jgi:GT2 family glycosyltransferase
LPDRGGLAVANHYRDPLFIHSGLWGNRLFLKPGAAFQIGLRYASPVRLIIGLYAQDAQSPLLFWSVPPAIEMQAWEAEFTLPDTVPADQPLQVKILIPDTQGEEVLLQEIFLAGDNPDEWPELLVGIVTFNRKAYVSGLLDQIQHMAYPPDKLKVVVVDNASSDGTADLLARDYPWIQLIRNTENRGGSGGFNTFFKHVLSLETPPPMAWLIDDDARIDRYTALHLVRLLLDREDAAIAGSVMVDLENPLHIWEAGGSLFQDRFGWKANILHRQVHELAHIRERSWEVGYAGAYSLVFRAEALRQAGIWQNYFLHVDDSEWGHRVQRVTGKKVLIALDSFIWHVLQGAAKPFTTLRYYETRNFLNYFALGGNRRAVRKVLLQCVAMGVKQLLIKRRDLCGYHIQGIQDFFHGPYGRKDLPRQAQMVKTIAEVLQAYRERRGKNPPALYVLKELNAYINDGEDHERILAQAARQLAPGMRIIEVSLHPDDAAPRFGDEFLHLQSARGRLGRILRPLWRTLLPHPGVMVLPFWNEGIAPNNLAALTAVYENNGYSLYWTRRFGLLNTLIGLAFRTAGWLWAVRRGKFDAAASKEI